MVGFRSRMGVRATVRIGPACFDRFEALTLIEQRRCKKKEPSSSVQRDLRALF